MDLLVIVGPFPLRTFCEFSELPSCCWASRSTPLPAGFSHKFDRSQCYKQIPVTACVSLLLGPGLVLLDFSTSLGLLSMQFLPADLGTILYHPSFFVGSTLLREDQKILAKIIHFPSSKLSHRASFPSTQFLHFEKSSSFTAYPDDSCVSSFSQSYRPVHPRKQTAL